MREYQVRICERLGVKFPGPTRQSRHLDRALVTSGLLLCTDIGGAGRHVSKVPQADSCTAAQKAAATRSLRGTLVLFLIGMCNVPRSNIAFEVTTPLREWSHIGKRSSARH
jgi:hypothetical protein